MDLDISVDDFLEENDEETQQTPAEIIDSMKEAWSNEKFAPEILPTQNDIVECLLDLISQRQKNLEHLDSSDFKKCIYQMEVDRLRYMVSSYLRTRLEKIETYCYHILAQETERINKEETPYLSEGEWNFLKEYIQGIEQHFEGVTNFAVVTDYWRSQPVTPNMHSFVFLKSKQEVEGVIIDKDDVVDLNCGSQAIIAYSSISELVKSGAVCLI